MYNYRDAEPKDNKAILDIFNHEAENETTVFELRARTQEEQQEWFEQHTGVYSVIVLETDNDILGFASLSPYRSRPGYKTTAESSIFIHTNHRGQGIGHELLEALIERARQNGFHTLIARIAKPNEASVKLHEACGFEFIGVEKEVARKFGKWLDCLVFQKML